MIITTYYFVITIYCLCIFSSIL